MRLEITSSNFPRYDRSPNTGHDFGIDSDSELRTAHQTIFHTPSERITSDIAGDSALRPTGMLLDLSHIGQIALPVSDVDRAEKFFAEVMGFRKLFRFGDLSFFDCAGVRLLLEKAGSEEDARKSSIIYFRCADIALAVRELKITRRPLPPSAASHRSDGRP